MGDSNQFYNLNSALLFRNFFYSRLPAEVPIQFGFDGGVNSWGSKMTVFLFPTLLLGVTFTTRSKYVDAKYPVMTRENHLHKIALIGCLLLVWGVGIYLFFIYAALLE
ncbi:DUF1648 domain-containing protein [Enterococcus avium]|uniref:DUF1648 domain-containing protein n=1 Tax=Enterococcus avium TaxID=33945 RepID=UPI0032E3DA26